jgi:hypothetical protein
MPSSVFLVQMAVDPFDRAAFVVAQRFRRRELDLLAIVDCDRRLVNLLRATVAGKGIEGA